MNRNALLLFIALHSFAATAFARQKDGCIAIYEASVQVSHSGLGDSVLKASRTDSSMEGNLNDERISDAIAELLQSMDQFRFSMQLEVRAVADSAIIRFSQPFSDEVGITMKISTPDSLLYAGGRWMSVKNGKREWMESTTIEWRETDETRMILGYRCQKYLQADTPEPEAIEIWASPDLPATLTPLSAHPLFKFGVLEMRNPQTGERIKLVRISCAEKTSITS